MNIIEGRVPVDGYSVWYRIVGAEKQSIPLLTLHGGPGAGHNYLQPLEELAVDRPVIFYDQLGCGLSDKPDAPALWIIDRFCREIDTLRTELDLSKVHIFGQSWGGWLAIEYMLGKPKGVASVVLANTSASIPQFTAEARRLIAALPNEVRETLEKYEAVEDYYHPEYEEAVHKFYDRHLCLLSPYPEPLERSAENLHQNQVYETINGPNEFVHIGNLKDWDRTDRLSEIDEPVLVATGRHDELTPACSETLHNGLPNSQLAIFENSSHVPFWEEREEYVQVLREFLLSVE